MSVLTKEQIALLSYLSGQETNSDIARAYFECGDGLMENGFIHFEEAKHRCDCCGQILPEKSCVLSIFTDDPEIRFEVSITDAGREALNTK